MIKPGTRCTALSKKPDLSASKDTVDFIFGYLEVTSFLELLSSSSSSSSSRSRRSRS